MLALRCFAQDIHLSQYDAHPLYLNPAMTGNAVDKNHLLKTNLGYRDQKLNVPGYNNTTLLFSFDMPLNDKFSIGQQMLSNNINNIYSTTSVMLSTAYHISSSKHPQVKSFHHLVVGLQLGFIQRNFSLSNFSFDSQYSSLSSNGFDTGIPNGENFSKQNHIDFDANMGMFYKYSNDTTKINPYLGFAVYHLTQPDQSVSSVFSSSPMRFTIHGGCDFKLNQRLLLRPQVLYLNQAKAKAINVGLMGVDKVNDSSNFETMLGFSWSLENAYIIHLGIRYKSTLFRVSYDVNASLLKQFGNNGLEFSIAYAVRRKVKQPVENPDENKNIEAPVKKESGSEKEQ